MKKLSPRLMILVLLAAVAASGGGWYYSQNMAGSGNEAAPTKVSKDPIPFEQQFIVNLADSDSMHYAKISLAVKLAPMSEEDWALFNAAVPAGGEGESAAEGAPADNGKHRVASNAELRDSVISTVSHFTHTELLAATGQADLKAALVAGFKEIASTQKAGKDHDPREAPYFIEKVYITDLAVQ